MGRGFVGHTFDLRISNLNLLSQVVERNARIGKDSAGPDSAIRALTRLTEHCREGMELASLEELNSQSPKSSDFLHALGASIVMLGNEFVIDWLDGYLQAMKYRFDNGQPRVADILFAQQLMTAVMKGQVAVPVVKALDIPSTSFALAAASALYTLSVLLEKPIQGDFELNTPILFLARLDTSELHRALAFGYEAMVDLYRFIEDGDEIKVELHVSTLERVAGYDTLADLRLAAQENIEIVDAEFEEVTA